MTVERAAWTDERLDDLAESMRNGFDRVDQDIRDLRGDMNDGFMQLRGEIAELRGEIAELRQTMIRFGGGMLIGMVVSFVSLFAAIIAQG